MFKTRRTWLQAALSLGSVGLPVGVSAQTGRAGRQAQLLVGMSMNNLLSLDPAGATGLDAVTVACNLYDSLIETDPHHMARLQPGLAEAWQVESGGRRLVFQLKPGLRFNTGQAITASHAAWSLQRVLKLNLAPATVWKSYGFAASQVESLMQASGPLTLQIQLPQATDPNLVLATIATSMGAYVIDRDTALKHEHRGDLGAAWLTTHAAGSGAFELEQWRPKELLIMRQALHHGRPPAKLARVVMRHMSESQTLRLMLTRGDLDVAGGLAAPDVQALSRHPKLKVDRVRRATQYYVALNARKANFADERIRRAILRHLLDFEGLAASVLPAYGEPQQRPVPLGLDAALPQPGYQFNLAEARRLLVEAGVGQGFATTIRVVAEPPFTAIATNVQATLAQAGIRATILPGTGNQVYGAMRDRQFDIIIGRGGGGAEAHPHSSLRALVYNPDNRDAARLSNFQGWRTGYADATLNDLIERALLQPDRAQQTALYHQAQQRFDAVVGALQPVAQMVETQVLQRDIQGYVGHPSGATRLREVWKS